MCSKIKPYAPLCTLLLLLLYTLHTKTKATKRHLTCMVFIAARNDLKSYAPYNLKQMEAVGSNQNITIIAQHHTSDKANKYISKTIHIEKNKQIVLEELSNVDSGSAEAVINFCHYAITHFPAEHYALILWDHGTGALEPVRNAYPLKQYDLSFTKLYGYEQDFLFNDPKRAVYLSFLKNISFQDHVSKKAMCFDDETKNFLSEHKLITALDVITKKFLAGKKLDIIGFDACLMAMIEVAAVMQEYAHIMVASQNVELGPGWNYTKVFTPFLLWPVTPEIFSKHIVDVYAQTYERMGDFTQSALLLSETSPLLCNITHVAEILKRGLKQQKNNSVKLTIQKSRNRHTCTHFDEPSFIDLYHFYSNILSNISLIDIKPEQQKNQLIFELQHALKDGLALIDKIILANKFGQSLTSAKGISIYFPEHAIHPSYLYSHFAKNSAWKSFLIEYLARQ